jgi:hypothetical protein
MSNQEFFFCMCVFQHEGTIHSLLNGLLLYFFILQMYYLQLIPFLMSSQEVCIPVFCAPVFFNVLDS